MPERDEYASGTPSWVDLGSPDIEASKDFYGTVFGWTAEDAGPPELTGGYALFMMRGRPVAGVGPLQPDQQAAGQPPAWSTYVSVDDCDVAVAAATAAGGTVLVEPMDVMTAGRMAFVADPQGAAFGLWQPGDHKGAGVVNEPGSLCWNEVVTTDVDAGSPFYGAVFGWKAAPFEGSEQPYTLLMLGEDGVAGMMARPAEKGDAPPHWVATFAVDDADATARTCIDNGATVMFGPEDMGVGRLAGIVDPQGAYFQVIKLASQ